MGTGLTLLILEACRRTTGRVLPIICVAFFLYAYYGGFLPITWPIGHAGVDYSQIINGFYNDQSGFYGIPLDVCATYIVLFTIYGAVLDATGAGRFFIDLSFAAFRTSRTAPGRTVTLSGFLLGTVSGSGTATTVSLGSVTWPILRRAGYPREQAGGMLAAAGIGAILSPPTLGAAAFIIAEYVRVPYLQVLLWATIPTLLYYLGIVLAVEIDARRFGAHAVHAPDPLRRQAAAALRLPLPVPVRDHLLPGAGRAAVPGRGLRDAGGRGVRAGGAGGLAAGTRCRRRPAGSLPAALRGLRRRPLPGAGRRHPRGAAGGRGVRGGRHHHLGHRQDRARARRWPTCWSARRRRWPATRPRC